MRRIWKSRDNYIIRGHIRSHKIMLSLSMHLIFLGHGAAKEFVKAVYCHLAYFCAEYIMRNARLDEAQAGIKIAGRNINNLRYADNTTLMAESEEEPMSLLIKVKEKHEKAGLKLNIQRQRSWHLVPSLHGK